MNFNILIKTNFAQFYIPFFIFHLLLLLPFIPVIINININSPESQSTFDAIQLEKINLPYSFLKKHPGQIIRFQHPKWSDEAFLLRIYGHAASHYHIGDEIPYYYDYYDYYDDCGYGCFYTYGQMANVANDIMIQKINIIAIHKIYKKSS